MPPPEEYSYRDSLKSGSSDELINTYVMRPVAGLIVRLLYPTSVTPNQVTLVSMVFGFVAAALYLAGDPATVAAAGLCITAKDVLDSADGQLARAKAMGSRTGRFLDSIGDIAVNLAVFGAIGALLAARRGMPAFLLLALAGFLGISLRVSYHVFYQTAFLHLQDAYGANRLTEEIRDEDLRGDPRALILQRVFRVLYGWQDALMVRIDRWSRAGNALSVSRHRYWYADPIGLRLSGFLGMGTELFLLTLFSLAGNLESYLWVNVLVMNCVWGGNVVYRRVVVRRRLFETA